MGNALLIYNLVPEDLRFYHLTNLTDEDFKLLKSAHGVYLNSVHDFTEEGERSARRVFARIHPKDFGVSEWEDEDKLGCWVDNFVYFSNEGRPIEGAQFDMVCQFGFLL